MGKATISAQKEYGRLIYRGTSENEQKTSYYSYPYTPDQRFILDGMISFITHYKHLTFEQAIAIDDLTISFKGPKESFMKELEKILKG